MKKFKFLALTLCLTLVNSLFQAPSISALNKSEITYFGNVSDYKDLIDSVFHDGLQIVNQQSEKFGVRYGFADMEGKIIVPLTYDFPSDVYHTRLNFYFKEGLAPVQKDGKWGYIDETGKVVIPFIYDDAADFSEGLAAVGKTKRSLGMIDRTGKIVVQDYYQTIDNKSDGYIYVQKSGKYGIIDNAMMLNGSKKQFNISWNDEYGKLNLISNTPYQQTGAELIEGNTKETNKYWI